MPITIQSFGAPVSGNGTSIATALPSGTSTGDLLILCVATANEHTPASIAGWTLADQATITGDLDIAVFWRIADGSGSDHPNLFIITDDYQSVMLRVTGHDPASPFDTSSTDTQTPAGSDFPLPALTTANASELLLAFATLPVDDVSGPPTGGWSLESYDSVSGFFTLAAWSLAAGAAGTYGPETVALVSGSINVATVALAFTETPGGGGGGGRRFPVPAEHRPGE